MAYLDKIQQENDIKNISPMHYDELALEIREFLVEKVSKNGGHLASNLGAVELTMALHLCMDFPEDKLIFDVGHQSYTHKILTGRKDDFDSLRCFGGMSGFPKTSESDCDVFNTGHSSTSISAAMGYAISRDMNHKSTKVAAVIGDGSMTGGMAYEALNCLAQTRTGMVIILNDNEMSIDKNVGGLSKYLNGIRVGSAYNELKSGVESSLLSTKAGTRVARTLKRSKDSIKQLFVPGMFFEELGITYVGPIDGHDIEAMVSTFKKAFKLNKPILIHVKTKKGKGYELAERHPSHFHGISPFDCNTGKTISKSELTYTDVFSKHLVEIGEKNKNIVAITAAMSIGTGLNSFGKKFPDRLFDVGIAEQHAVTFAAGMASAGMIPVVAIYSSFLQRAYDQILHDVCLQKLHVIFAIDRSGLVGQDGETHQGIYDISYLSHLPGMVVMAPKDGTELISMMDFAVKYDGPIAIKYPRGNVKIGVCEYEDKIELNKSEIIHYGSGVAIFACGSMFEEAVKLVELLKQKGINPMLVNTRFVSSVDTEVLELSARNCEVIVTMEENVKEGGYGERLAASLIENKLFDSSRHVHVNGAISGGMVCQGKISELRSMLEIDAESMFKRVMSVL